MEKHKKFDGLCKLILAAKEEKSEVFDFVGICRNLRVDDRVMENMFYKEFGMSPEDFINNDD